MSSRTVPRKSILKNSNRPKHASSSLFATSKRDKRQIKHEQLLSRIAKSAQPKARRRRPNKKLATTLDALADALPDDDEIGAGGRQSGSKVQDQVNIIRRKSIKSKPGAMKRREKLDRGERDRFAKNMAQMATSGAQDSLSQSATDSQTLPSGDRWKALRGFIAQTLEKKVGLES